MANEKMPMMLGRGSLAPQWDSIKDDVTAPQTPNPDADKPITLTSVAKEIYHKMTAPKPQFKGITHVGD